MPKHEKVTDDELLAAIQEELAAADYSGTNELSFQREQSTRSYNGVLTDGLQPTTGMSSVVNNKIQPAIETLTTWQSNIFCSDSETVIFSSTNEKMAPVAEQTTKVVNHFLHKVNPGYEIINRWIKDAAINKNGVVKITWDHKIEGFKEEIMSSDDIGMNERIAHWEAQGYESEIIERGTSRDVIEVSDNDTGEVVEIEEEMQKVVVQFTRKRGYPRIENVPPEEFLINERATSINGDIKTRFVCQRQIVSLSKLLEDFPEVDSDDLFDAAGTTGYLEYEYERLNRHAFDGTYDYTGTDPSSGPNRNVEVIESWIRSDRDGDGVAEMRHCISAGKLLLLDEEWFGDIPFASFTFFPIPHKFYGLSIYDKLQWYHRTASMLLRSEVDIRLQQNTFRLIANPRDIDIRDLQSGRPGIIKAKPGFDPKTVMPLTPSSGAGNTPQILDYLHREIIGQIGIDPNTGQISTDVEKSGNDSAKTAMIQDNASAKMQAFAREFAETGLRDVVWQVTRLLLENADDMGVQRVVEKLTPGTPFLLAEEGVSEFFDRDDITAKVGLGHQTMQQRLQASQAIMQAHQALEASPAAPVAIPAKNKIAAAAEMAIGLGYDDPSKFFPSVEEVEAEQARQAQQAQAALAQQQQMVAAQMQEEATNNESKRKLEDAKAQEAIVKASAAQRNQELSEEAKVTEIDNIKFDNDLNLRRQEAQEEQMSENTDMQREKLEFEYAKLEAEKSKETNF